LIVCERTVLQWANKMVIRCLGALTGDRCVVVTIGLHDCRGVAVAVDVIDVEVVGRQGRLNKLRILNDEGFIFVNQKIGWCRSRKNAWCWWRERSNLTK
jgi:hypothetical protein